MAVATRPEAPIMPPAGVDAETQAKLDAARARNSGDKKGGFHIPRFRIPSFGRKNTPDDTLKTAADPAAPVGDSALTKAAALGGVFKDSEPEPTPASPAAPSTPEPAPAAPTIPDLKSAFEIPRGTAAERQEIIDDAVQRFDKNIATFNGMGGNLDLGSVMAKDFPPPPLDSPPEVLRAYQLKIYTEVSEIQRLISNNLLAGRITPKSPQWQELTKALSPGDMQAVVDYYKNHLGHFNSKDLPKSNINGEDKVFDDDVDWLKDVQAQLGIKEGENSPEKTRKNIGEVLKWAAGEALKQGIKPSFWLNVAIPIVLKKGLLAATGLQGQPGAVVGGALVGGAMSGGKEWLSQMKQNRREFLQKAEGDSPEAKAMKKNLKEKFRVLRMNNKGKVGKAALKGAVRGAIGGLIGYEISDYFAGNGFFGIGAAHAAELDQPVPFAQSGLPEGHDITAHHTPFAQSGLPEGRDLTAHVDGSNPPLPADAAAAGDATPPGAPTASPDVIHSGMGSHDSTAYASHSTPSALHPGFGSHDLTAYEDHTPPSTNVPQGAPIDGHTPFTQSGLPEGHDIGAHTVPTVPGTEGIDPEVVQNIQENIANVSQLDVVPGSASYGAAGQILEQAMGHAASPLQIDELARIMAQQGELVDPAGVTHHLTVPEWGIQGDLDQTRVPIGSSFVMNDTIRNAIVRIAANG